MSLDNREIMQWFVTSNWLQTKYVIESADIHIG